MQEFGQLATQTLTTLINTHGLLSVFILMAAQSIIIPIPSEIIMPFAGFLAERGVFGFWTVVLIGTVGNVFGSLIAYYIGYAKGEEWIRLSIKKWGKFMLVREKEFDKANRWFKKYGQAAAFISRLLPIVRTYISLPAGVAKVDVKLFTVLTFIGSFVWSAFLAWLGFELGENWQTLEPYFRKFQYFMVGLGGFFVIAFLLKHLKFSRK